MTVASPSRPVRRDAPSSLTPTFPQPAVSTSAAPAAPAVSSPVLAVAPQLPASAPVAAPAAAPPAERVAPPNDLAYSTGDAASYSLMVGLGETYFSAFALAIGTGQTFAGLLATLPQLAGSLLQLAAPWGVKKLGSQRRWIVTFVSLQASSLLLLPLAAFFTGGL